MLLICDKKYLLLPASHEAQKKRLFFYHEDKLVLDLVISLDTDEPDYVFPVDLARFHGMTLRLHCEPQMEFPLEMADTPHWDYSGKYRPVAHFTSRRGWINDPNGLVQYSGKYYMYFQHNPAATTWENMHWGAAVSTDLMHWQEQGDAIFPDENGTIFSGGGIVDTRNVSGLKSGTDDPILLFYTSAGDTSATSKGKPFTQRLAYSTDGGKTLQKYPEPLLQKIAHENRDPKVVYHPATDSYIMALYLIDHDFALFRSKDLLHWEELQRITLPSDAECPDFYPLALNGNANDIRWVFIAASDRYIIGSFDGEHFLPETEELRLHYGDGSYAAQSWAELAGGRRVRTAFAKIPILRSMPFGCCMNIPQEMSLQTWNGAPHLCAWPVPEIQNLYTSVTAYDACTLSKGVSFQADVTGKACDITLSLRCKESCSISLFGLQILYDPAAQLLRCGDCTAPVTGKDDEVTLRMLFDTLYTEIFADNGSVYLSKAYVQDSMLHTLTITSKCAEITAVSIAALGKWWENADT